MSKKSTKSYNQFARKDLKKFKQSLENWDLEYTSKATVKEYLEFAVCNLIVQNTEYRHSAFEKTYIDIFRRLEFWGWDVKDTQKVLQKWVELGDILRIENAYKKLDSLNIEPNLDQVIKTLEDLKLNKKINCEIVSAVQFYRKMRVLMDTSINNTIAQLRKSISINEMLLIFASDVDKFCALETDEMTFGDTEDRETVGEFFNTIMAIIGMPYSRGILRDKLS